MFQVSRSVLVASLVAVSLMFGSCSGPGPNPPAPSRPSPDVGPEPAGESADAALPETPAVSPAPPVPLPPPYDALLRPWQPWDPGWPERAGIVVTGTLEQGKYPCIFYPDGRSVMPLRRTIVIEQVLQGSLPRGDFDLAGAGDPSAEFPLDYHAGRRYLIFLRPSEQAAALLQDPARRFSSDTQLRQREFVAIVDLDQSEDEARRHREQVVRWRELEAFAFTAEGWRAMREATTVDLRQIEAFFHVLRLSVVKDQDRRDSLREALGPPDEERRDGDDTVEVYQLNLAARRAPSAGMVTGRIELTFTGEGLRSEYVEQYEVFENGRFRDATYEELQAWNLTTHGVDWGWLLSR
jgi:hypothetical protein